MADLHTGEIEPTLDRVQRLLDEIRPAAHALDCAPEVLRAGELLVRSGAKRQRVIGAEHGVEGLVHWLASRFASGPEG
jgi:hypothetical protein